MLGEGFAPRALLISSFLPSGVAARSPRRIRGFSLSSLRGLVSSLSLSFPSQRSRDTVGFPQVAEESS